MNSMMSIRPKHILSVIVSTGLAFVLAFFAMLAEARAQQNPRMTYVNPIRVSGLAPFQGRFLTIYYGLGSRGSLSNQENQVSLREVKEKRTFAISGDSLMVPEVFLKRSNLMISYNIILFVIHSAESFTWVNGNRSLPEGETMSNSTLPLQVDSLTKIDFEGILAQQGISGNTPVQYSWGQGFTDTSP